MNALAIPKGIFIPLERYIRDLNGYDMVELALTFKSYGDADQSTFTLKTTISKATLLDRVRIERQFDQLGVGYPFMKQSFMVFNSDLGTVGSCPGKFKDTLTTEENGREPGFIGRWMDRLLGMRISNV